MSFQVQYQSLAMSSFVLWLNNLLISKGGYLNVGTKFFPSPQVFNGYTTFSAPFKPINYDISVAGVNNLSGIYFNNSFLTPNQSGFAGVDFNRSNVYFTGSNTPSFVGAVVSGNYSIPEYNIMFPAPDLNLIFDGKISLRPKSSYNSAVTGLNSNEIPYPVIMLRNEGLSNQPYQFGGIDLTTTNIGVYIFSDNVYNLDNLKSILIDRKTDYIPLFAKEEMPLNTIGFLKSGNSFNYTGASAGKIPISGIWIKDVVITDFNKRGLFSEVGGLPSNCYFGIAEFEICIPRRT